MSGAILRWGQSMGSRYALKLNVSRSGLTHIQSSEKKLEEKLSLSMLENKAVLITGGSRGIGAQIVRQAMQEGAQVVFTYKASANAANTLAQELAAEYPGQDCLAFQADVADV